MKRLIQKRTKQKNILENEPYASFIKQFEEFNGNFDESINIRITSQNFNSSKIFNGFSLDYIYCKYFNLDFMFGTLIDEKTRKEKFCIYHVLSFTYDLSYEKIMRDVAEDINRKNGYFYISSLCQECEMETYLSDKNKVCVTFNIYCDKKDAKEICLQLLSLDIGMFARSF